MTRVRRDPLFSVESGTSEVADPDIFPAAVGRQVLLGLWSALLLVVALLVLVAVVWGTGGL